MRIQLRIENPLDIPVRGGVIRIFQDTTIPVHPFPYELLSRPPRMPKEWLCCQHGIPFLVVHTRNISILYLSECERSMIPDSLFATAPFEVITVK